ncbi:MAG: prolipoprotein diacylglyceryl transferase [Gammaproteobacteria bacterium]|nr:prolipoprotein diacylglyceryl transferase [Gammaproteobacteria bacterium]
MIEFPNFDPVALQIGPLALRWYGIMYLIGFAAAWWLGRRRAARPDSPVRPEHIDDLIFYGAIGVILGGRIGSMFFYNLDQLAEDPLAFFRIWEGGMSFHGGLLGVIAAMALYARKLRVGFLPLMDFVAPLVPIGLGTGRIGNFINGELWGKPTDVPWAVVVDGVPRHASQLYEATLEGLALFIVLWWYSSRPRPVMSVAGLFLLGYGLARFAVEFLRLPDAHIGYLAGGWFTMGMLLTLPMIAGGIYMLARARATGAAR